MKKMFVGILFLMLNAFVAIGCAPNDQSVMMHDSVDNGNDLDAMLEGYDDVDVSAEPLYEEMPSIKK